MERKKENVLYYIYIIGCVGDRLYTGITTDYKRRFMEHSGIKNAKRGAKFTKCFKPEKILALWTTDSKSKALKLEYRIKRLKRVDKLSLIKNNKLFNRYFSECLSKKDYKRGKYA